MIKRTAITLFMTGLIASAITSGITKQEYYTDTYIVTAYTHTGSTMANGEYPHVGACAVDNSLHKFGTKFDIPGYGKAVAKDTGGGVCGKHLDVFFNSEDECISWGAKKLKVRVYY